MTLHESSSSSNMDKTRFKFHPYACASPSPSPSSLRPCNKPTTTRNISFRKLKDPEDTVVQHDLTGTSRTPAWLNVASRTSRTSRILSLCSRPLCKDDAKGLTTDVNALLSGTPLPPSPSVDSLHSVPLEPRSQRGSRITQDEKAPLNHPVDPSPTTDSRPSAARFQGTLSSLCATAIPESNSSDSATGIPESSSSDNNGTQSGSLPADTLLFSDDWLSEFNQTFVENEEYFRLFPDDTKQQSPPHGSSSTAQNLEPLEDGAKQHATPDSSSAVQEAIEMFSAWMGQHAMEGPNFRQGCVNPAHLTIPPGQSSRFYAENDAPAVFMGGMPEAEANTTRMLATEANPYGWDLSDVVFMDLLD